MRQWKQKYTSVKTIFSTLGTSTACLVVVLLFLAFPSSAFAYLDPGTGSLLLQLLFSGIAGVLVIAKLYWKRIEGFFGRLSKPTERNRDSGAGK